MSRRTIYSQDYELLLSLLREARDRSGMTQAVLAKRLGMTQSALSKCERGELRLDVVQTRNWCRALKVPFASLIADFDRLAGR